MVDPKVRSAWSELNEEIGDKKGPGSVYGVRQMCQIFSHLFLHSDQRYDLPSEVDVQASGGGKLKWFCAWKMGGPTYKAEKAKGNQVVSQKTSSR